MDGLLIIDKPIGPTSHDVVARMRRALGEPRIGHTGTLDPMASGVLPLVLGRATRLARFLSASDKHYDAVIRLGQSTDTCDATGQPVGAQYDGPLPSRETIERALDRFRGSFLQQPPSFSAKKVGGQRSYRLARAQTAGATPPAPAAVTAYAVEIIVVDGAALSIGLRCSAGFYVRALAHDLGQALGTGAHLASLRRTQSGPAALADAVALEDAEREPRAAADRLIPMRRLLLDLPSATLTSSGRTHAAHGRELEGSDVTERWGGDGPQVRLLDTTGELIGVASPGRTPGALHPSIVLM